MKVLFFVIGASLFVSAAYAQEPSNPYCITFDHSSIGQRFYVDNILLSSNDMVASFQPFEWRNETVYRGGHAFISDDPRFVFEGESNGLWTNNINLHFHFPRAINRISLHYGSWGGNLNIGVREKRINVGRSIIHLDGKSIEDALFSIYETCDISRCWGKLDITGQSIYQFLIGGQEFGVDNICIDVDITAKIDDALNLLDTLVVDPEMQDLVKQLIEIRKRQDSN